MNQLRVTFDPIAKTALVQGLCVRVFGSNAEKVFVAGYPELAPESIASSEDSRTTEDRIEDIRKGILRAAGRYFSAGYDSNAPCVAQVICALKQSDGSLIDGVLVILNGSVCSFDLQDLAVEDISDGSPILIDFENINSFTVIKTVRLTLDPYSIIEVQRSLEDLVQLDVRTGSHLARLLIDFEGLEVDARVKVERDLRKILHLIDRELLYNRELER